MQVTALNGVMNDAHAEADARLAQRPFHQLRPLILSQVADARLQSQRHVDRMARREFLPRQVRHAGPEQPRMRPRARTACSFAAAAAAWKWKSELSRHSAV